VEKNDKIEIILVSLNVFLFTRIFMLKMKIY